MENAAEKVLLDFLVWLYNEKGYIIARYGKRGLTGTPERSDELVASFFLWQRQREAAP